MLLVPFLIFLLFLISDRIAAERARAPSAASASPNRFFYVTVILGIGFLGELTMSLVTAPIPSPWLDESHQSTLPYTSAYSSTPAYQYGSGGGSVGYGPAPPSGNVGGFRSFWKPSRELRNECRIDVYPSQTEAIQAVAAEIVAAFPGSSAITLEADPASTRVPASSAILQELTDETQRQTGGHPAKQRSLSDASPPAPKLIVTLSDEATPDAGRTLTVSSAAPPPAPSAVFSARFTQKPWVSLPEDYRQHTGNSNFVVGHSASFWPTAEAAETDAWFALTAQLAEQLWSNEDNTRSWESPIFPELRSLAEALRGHPKIQGHFTQHLDDADRTVYRSAVLFDATSLPRRFTFKNDSPLDWTDQTPINQFFALEETSGGIDPAEFARPAPQRIPLTTPPHPISLPRLVNQYPNLSRALGLAALITVTLILYRALNRWTRGQRQGFLQLAAVSALLVVAAVLGVLSL